MFCSHCGKKVTETMLFCPFCGDPIVIPDQDEDIPEPAPASASKPVETAEAQEAIPQIEPEPPEAVEPAPEPEMSETEAELLSWSRDRESLVAEDAEPADHSVPEAFSPLILEASETPAEDWREEIARRKEAAAPEKKPPERHLSDEPSVRLDGRAPTLEGEKPSPPRKPTPKQPRSANTYVPPKAMNPDDIFMSGSQNDYDRFDDDPYDRVPEPDDDGYAYEDEQESSFFLRHIRGIVALTMLAILALLFVIYTFTDAGQRSLARMNLASNKEVYTRIAYEYYQGEQYDLAGQYYERALARDPSNYTHASSAAMAYVTGNNTEKAAAMLKKCIEIDPGRVEPYVYLLNLYPDAAQRPWDVTQLIQQGYQKTGDSRLNVTG